MIACLIRHEIDPAQRAEQARENFAFAPARRFLAREARTFLEIVEGSLGTQVQHSRENEN